MSNQAQSSKSLPTGRQAKPFLSFGFWILFEI
jgi:hypothetical protein